MKTRFHFIALAAACATAAAITPVAHAAIRFIDTNTTLGVDTADIWIGTATPTTACTVTASAATNITGNINVFNLSTFNMSAGRVTGIYANNSSRVTLSGGATNSLHLHNIPTPGATASLALAGLTTIKRKRPSARST